MCIVFTSDVLPENKRWAQNVNLAGGQIRTFSELTSTVLKKNTGERSEHPYYISEVRKKQPSVECILRVDHVTGHATYREGQIGTKTDSLRVGKCYVHCGRYRGNM